MNFLKKLLGIKGPPEGTKDWDYCENCGKKGAQLFELFSQRYSFCHEGCQEQFGNKLFAGGAYIFCPYCRTRQPITKKHPRICRQCHGNMDDLREKPEYQTQQQAKKNNGVGESESAEINETLRVADETLYQSNSPEYEIDLSNRLMQSPEATVRAIEDRGWHKRGTAEEANLFLIRVLARILKETDESIKEKALNVLVQIFSTPDDNTAGWVTIIETTAKIIANSQMQEAKPKLESLKKNLSGKNLQAIDYARYLSR